MTLPTNSPQDPFSLPSLQELEREVWAEGMEFMRKRMQERFDQETARKAAIFPPEPGGGDLDQAAQASAAPEDDVRRGEDRG